ncbi:MAG: FtsX-like permease family protein [Candidatus Margulisbacteria bacterium]|nr:FtsX-like permease family protein [Candidatus Margulisiibacteriota bacterium]
MLFKLAFRNVFRNFRRTLLTLSALAVAIMLLIIFDSYFTGLDLMTYEKIIDYETAHLTLWPLGYKADIDNLPIDKAFDPAPVLAVLRADPMVKAVTPRISFRATLSNGIYQLPAVGLAVDPVRDETVFTMKKSVNQGEYLVGSEEAIVLGVDLAKDFNVGAGDTLTVLCRTKHSTFQALDLPIKGIIRSDNYQIDVNTLLIPLSLAQRSLDLGNGVTAINIRLKDIKQIGAFQKKYADRFPGLELWNWKEVAEDVVAHSESHAMMKNIMFACIIIIALVGISNTILIAAFERTREIGMLGAMGMKRRQIVGLFVLEGTLIGAVGSAIGCLLGFLLMAFWATRYGFDLSFAMKSWGNVGFRTMVFLGAWNVDLIPKVFVFGVVVSALSSVYPALVASRMEPTVALRKG